MIELPGRNMLEGNGPVVILGPNGSGKTQLASQIAGTNGAEFINALRNIQLEDQLSSQSLAQASNQLKNEINNRRSNYWQLANEIQILFSKLLAEDAASAIRFRDSAAGGKTALPEDTVLTRVRRLWAEVFPGRTVDFADGAPKVTTEYAASGAATYAASRMSDGERVALYLAGRVLNVSSSIVMIDEPEVHFHSRLAVRFWDALEAARPELRFVYVTHDLAFALSREAARFVLVRPNQPPQVLELSEAMPTDLARSILGAASFSVYAERIVFCEGTESGPDFRILSSWTNDRQTAVIPVGSCEDVLRCCDAFNREKLVAGVTSVGIIDRDFRSDAFLSELPAAVSALPVHECEALYCVPEVLRAVAVHLGKDADEVVKQFEAAARAKCAEPAFVHKVTLERTKSRVEPLLAALLATAKSTDDATTVRSSLSNLASPASWSFNPVTVFDEELARLNKSTEGGSLDEMLRLFPGKPLLPLAASALGIDRESLTGLVQSALKSKEPQFQVMGATIAAILSPHLPPRATPKQAS